MCAVRLPVLCARVSRAEAERVRQLCGLHSRSNVQTKHFSSLPCGIVERSAVVCQSRSGVISNAILMEHSFPVERIACHSAKACGKQNIPDELVLLVFRFEQIFDMVFRSKSARGQSSNEQREQKHSRFSDFACASLAACAFNAIDGTQFEPLSLTLTGSSHTFTGPFYEYNLNIGAIFYFANQMKPNEASFTPLTSVHRRWNIT
jgi:hypothetical protein